MYWLIRYAEIAALDANPQLWHGLYVGLGVESAVLSYVTVRSLEADRLPAAIGAAALVGWAVLFGKSSG